MGCESLAAALGYRRTVPSSPPNPPRGQRANFIEHVFIYWPRASLLSAYGGSGTATLALIIRGAFGVAYSINVGSDGLEK